MVDVPILTLSDLAAGIRDGTLLCVPPDYSGVALAATLAVIARGTRRLRLVCVPTSGLQADLLIGSGAVQEIEAAAVTLGEFGGAPRFIAALKDGLIRIKDATCPAIHAGLQAAEKGLPFMPLRGILGSDLLRVRTDWRLIENPYQPGDQIVALPAIRPDVALFHAPLADRHGNVWVGRARELMTMAHAARSTLVTVEEVQDRDFLAEPEMAAGVIPALYVSGIAPAPGGAWPIGLTNRYGPDQAALQDYAVAARTRDGFDALLERWLRPGRVAAE